MPFFGFFFEFCSLLLLVMPKPISFTNTLQIAFYIQKGDSFLMIRKRHPEVASEVWDVPHGVMQQAESIILAAKRVAKETIGLDIKKFRILCITDPLDSTGYAYTIGIEVEEYSGAPVIIDEKYYEEIRFYTEIDMPDDMTPASVSLIENKLLSSIHPLNRGE